MQRQINHGQPFVIRHSSFVIHPPPVLTIAGSDCSSGAGIQADLKTFTALGCYGLTALTSVVAEVPSKVTRIQLLEAAMIQDQITVLAETFPIAAAKTGMLGGKSQIASVIAAWHPLAKRGIPLVIDPVMVATSGRRLLEVDALTLLLEELFPLATIITPNLDEASVLLEVKITNRQEMEQAAHALASRFSTAILLKGGHLGGNIAPDILVAGDEVHWFEAPRVHGVHTHGTGCTYSAAIAAGLAKGLSLAVSVQQGKDFVTHAITRHYRWGNVDALNHHELGIP